MAELKTISGDPAAATEIFKRLLEIYDKDGTTNVAAVLCAAGALGGFACQQAVWKRYIEPGARNPGDFLVKVSTKLGETLYFGEAINMFLVATSEGVFSFYSFAAGAVPDPSKLPDLRESFRRAAAEAGTPDFWTLKIPGPPGGFLKAPNLLNDHWGWVQETLIRHGNTPAEWPAVLGFVAHRAIKGGAQKPELAPLFCWIVMETAILASKLDPRLVVGATSGLDPGGAWSHRAVGQATQKDVMAEVLPFLPHEIPR